MAWWRCTPLIDRFSIARNGTARWTLGLKSVLKQEGEVGLKYVWPHHAFLDEDLGSLEGSGQVLTKSLSLLLTQNLAVEGPRLPHPSTQHLGTSRTHRYRTTTHTMDITHTHLRVIVIVGAVVTCYVWGHLELWLQEARLAVRVTEAVGEVVWSSALKTHRSD